MSHSEMVLNSILYFGVLITLTYLIYRYARYSRWEDSDAGRAFMGMKVCFLSLVLFAFTGQIWEDAMWRDVLRPMVVGGIWAALIYQVHVMVRRQGGFFRGRSIRRWIPFTEDLWGPDHDRDKSNA